MGPYTKPSALERLKRLLQNRRKPIRGAIAFALTYVAATVGVSLDPELAATLSGIVFAFVVERSYPVFGYPRSITTRGP